jgi:hypothetical protein
MSVSDHLKDITPEKAIRWAEKSDPNFRDKMRSDFNSRVMFVVFQSAESLIRHIYGATIENDNRILSYYCSKKSPMVQYMSSCFKSINNNSDTSHTGYIIIGCGTPNEQKTDIKFDFYTCTIIDLSKSI